MEPIRPSRRTEGGSSPGATRRSLATRRRVIRGVGAGVAALSGAACGAPDREAGRDTGGAQRRVDLTLMAYGDQVIQQQYEGIARALEGRFAGRYTLSPTIVAFAEYIPKATAMFASDTAPDVVNTWAQFKPEWVTKNLLLDLTGRIKGSKTAHPGLFLQPMVDAMTWQGKLWGTAQDFNGQLLYLNADLFGERGIALPADSWSMDDYRQLARRLTDPEKQVFGTTNLANSNGAFNFALLWNYGKHFWVSEDLTRSRVGSPQSVQVHQFFADLQYKDRTVPYRDNPLPTGTGARQGTVAIFLAWGNEPFWLTDTATKEGRQPFRWKPMLPPKGPQDQKTFSHGHLWSVPKASRRPDDAWVLAEWVGGLEGWKEWVQSHRQPLPVRDPELWKTYYNFLPAEEAATMTDFMVRRLYAGAAFNFQYWPTFADCQRVVTDAQRAIFADGADVKTTLEDAARLMDAILQQAKG
jgi:multiple sugar transport system substrate-binding protein